MMRKMLSAVLVLGLVFCVFGILCQPSEAAETLAGSGKVYDSKDGVMEIYDGMDNWICNNITTYRVVDPENITIYNGTADTGYDSTYFDVFEFNLSANWPDWNSDDEVIAVGEGYKEGRSYIFLTNCIIPRTVDPSADFADTEWELIPTPILYAKGDTWINISVPKFTNPVLAKHLHGGIGTPNANNTIGFAVYRNGTEPSIGNAPYWNETHYFYNDTPVSSGVVYHYSVAPIAKGNYTAYGKSLLASSEELSVVLNSPTTGDEVWAGGSSHDISYTITGGSAPYNVVMSYSTNGGTTYPNIINTTVKEMEGECTYAWTLPEDDLNAVKVKVEVTDDAPASKSDASDNIFIIDSTAPTVESTIPYADGSISIKKPVTIVFSEEMNKTATQAAFSISPDPLGWSWLWHAGDTMTGSHNDFVFDTTYTITVTTAAKDLAGNYLAEDYSRNFTANMSVCLNSPKLGDVWTGENTHDIEYEIIGGVAPYNVTIEYSTDGGATYPNLLLSTDKTETGSYNYSWTLPTLDLTTVNVRIILVDGNETESMDTSRNFEIDSTAPYIITYTGNTYIATAESITVVFSEEMNKASAESAFTLKNSSGNPVNGTFSWNGNAMMFTPDAELMSAADYTATVNTNATDKSDPGNALDKDYPWSFIAIEGRGDFAVTLNVPSSPEKGKTYTITVTVSNTGDEAFNISGFLTVKFYKSRDGETWTPIATEYIQNIWAGNSSSASTAFTFDDYGSYYFRVEITSKNPVDTFPGDETTGRASASINISEPSEEIGLGPYTLIAVMVVIVVIVAALILLNLKKKGELTLKEKTKEEKEEGEKEEEEMEKEESEEEEEKG